MTLGQQVKHTRNKRLIRLGCITLSPVALFLTLFIWYFWSNTRHYSDRPALLSAMLRLQLAGEQITSVGGRSDVLLIKVRGHQATLDKYLGRSGWSRVDWMGAEGQCRKGEQKMRVVNLAMTGYFRIIGLGHAPYVVRGAK